MPTSDRLGSIGWLQLWLPSSCPSATILRKVLSPCPGTICPTTKKVALSLCLASMSSRVSV